MRRGLERRQSWGRRRSAGFSLACRRPHAPNTQGPSQARAACGSRPGPGSSLSSLGSEVSAEMPAGGGQLRDGDSCPSGLTRSDGPPSPAGAPAAPSVMAHQDCVHPPPPPNPPAGIFPVLQAVGHIFQILGPLLLPPQIPCRPPAPSPCHGKGRSARTLARLSPGRGRSSWPGPAAVRCGGAKEKSPDYGGVMGKLRGDAPQTPPARSPVPLLHRISGLQVAPEGGGWGSNRNHCVRLATGSAPSIHLPGQSYLAQGGGTSPDTRSWDPGWASHALT